MHRTLTRGRTGLLLLAGDGVTLRTAAGELVHRTAPLGAVVDGEVADPEVLGGLLRDLVREHGLPRRVRVAVADTRHVASVVRLPAALDGEGLAQAARFAATDVLPVDADELAVGTTRLGRAADDATEQRALLVIARRDGVARLQTALARARLTAEAIEPASGALARAAGPEGTTLRVDVGAVTTLALAEDGACTFAHVAPRGAAALTTEVAARLGMDEALAADWVTRVATAGLDAPQDGDEVVLRQVRHALRDGLHGLAADVRIALQFHDRREAGAPAPEAVVLSGACAAWPDLAAALELELELPVVVAPSPASALLDGLAAVRPGAADLRLPGRNRPERRPARTGRALPAAVVALTIVCGALAGVVHARQAVDDREGRLAAARAHAEQLARQAAALAPYGRLAEDRAARERAAGAVLDARLPWEDVLDDIAAVAGDDVRLRVLRLTATGQGSAAAGAAGVRSSRPGPALEAGGCAATQRAVADLLDDLLQVRGVTTVALDRQRRRRSLGEGCQDSSRPVSFTVVGFLGDGGTEG